jgi:hypothetical protein
MTHTQRRPDLASAVGRVITEFGRLVPDKVNASPRSQLREIPRNAERTLRTTPAMTGTLTAVQSRTRCRTNHGSVWLRRKRSGSAMNSVRQLYEQNT